MALKSVNFLTSKWFVHLHSQKIKLDDCILQLFVCNSDLIEKWISSYCLRITHEGMLDIIKSEGNQHIQ